MTVDAIIISELSWMLMLVELDVGSIYPNPVLGFGKFDQSQIRLELILE